MTDPKFATLKDIGHANLIKTEKQAIQEAIHLMSGDDHPWPGTQTLPYFTAWYTVYCLCNYVEHLKQVIDDLHDNGLQVELE